MIFGYTELELYFVSILVYIIGLHGLKNNLVHIKIITSVFFLFGLVVMIYTHLYISSEKFPSFLVYGYCIGGISNLCINGHGDKRKC